MNKFYIEKNSYCTKIYVGTDANGKPKYRKLKAQSEKELEKKIREFKNAMDNGLNILKNNDTLLNWINHYLESIENEVIFLKVSLKFFVQSKEMQKKQQNILNHIMNPMKAKKNF